MPEHADIDRTSICRQPRGWPVMYQTWQELLFLHWPIAPERLRPLIPAGLEIDTWEENAWIGITPFTMRNVRPVLAPALPRISRSHELNVRTYVHHDGIPGVWFFSLDASNALAVWAARATYFLPYYRAAMQLRSSAGRTEFRSARVHRGAPPAQFEANWQRGTPLPEAAPGTLDFFLVERYCLYSARSEQLYRARIHHHPWPLCTAEVEHLALNMLQPHGLSTPAGPPLVHAQAEPLRVGIWPVRRVNG